MAKTAARKYSGYYTVLEFRRAFGISKNVAQNLLDAGLFPNRQRLGRMRWLLPDADVEQAVKFLRMSPIKRVRFLADDYGLILAGTVEKLVGISRSGFADYRKRGLMPEPRGRTASGAMYYHAGDVVRVAESNGMWYDKELAHKLLDDLRDSDGDRVTVLPSVERKQ